MSTLLAATGAINEILVALPMAIPNPDPVQPPGTDGFNDVMGWAKWIALACCILGLFAAGAMMAFNSRRGEGGEHVGRIGYALGGVIVISAAVALVGFLAT
jgi:peptidoglycan/LPS O-acetylase OafA/YrhL